MEVADEIKIDMRKSFENNKNVADANLFENLAKTFPADPTGLELVVMLMAVVLSGVSVIPNYYFGGGFGKEFAQSIAKKYEANLSPTEAEYFRLSGALLSAIFNGCINARSMNGAVWTIVDQGKEFKIPGNFGKAFIGLLGLLVLSGIATVPNIQFIEDTIKGWTGAAYWSLQVVSGLITGALNLRGLVVLEKFRSSHTTFGQKQREAAREKRLAVLTALNNKLPDEEKLSLEDIGLLSAGTLYRDKYPLVRYCTSVVMAGAPVLYSLGGYFFSAKDAMQTIERTDKIDNDFWYYAAMASVYSVSTIAFAVKWGFLARANYDVTQNLFNRFLAKEIISSKSPYDPPPIIRYLLEAIAVVGGALSLTGGFGLVERYLLDNANTLGTNIGSIFITLIAAISINYKDSRDVSVNAGEEFFKTLDKIADWKINNYKITTEDKFGKSANEFILKAMVNIAKTGDSQILERYGDKLPVYDLNEEDEFVNKNNHVYSDMLNEINALNADTFEKFINSYGSPKSSPNVSSSSTPIYTESENESLLIINDASNGSHSSYDSATVSPSLSVIGSPETPHKIKLTPK